MKEFSEIVRALAASPVEGAVLATLVSVRGSSYRRPGARLLVFPDGRRIGSISGGCLESDVIARTERVRRTGEAEVALYDTTEENDLVWGVGLGCHGIVQVVIEPLPSRPPWAMLAAEALKTRTPLTIAVEYGVSEGAARSGTRVAADARAEAGTFVQTIGPTPYLAIFGAGDDAIPLSRFAAELGWQVGVFDPRPAFPTRERFPAAHVHRSGPAEALVEEAALDAAAVAVVMTHHYIYDMPLLRGLLARGLRYLGVLGPKQRTDRILADLQKEGTPIPAGLRERLRAPVGLDLGADGPEQVSLAIVAEIQAVLAGRDARPLRERQRPIHATD
jgi:xanthine/CO dehydrogenase XdhC/CoxF family maturation factor